MTLPTFKIVLIGDSGVGKSSLLSRYFDNEFMEYYNATMLQIGTLKYLTGLDESMVWQFYRPALEHAFINEQTWAD